MNNSTISRTSSSPQFYLRLAAWALAPLLGAGGTGADAQTAGGDDPKTKLRRTTSGISVAKCVLSAVALVALCPQAEGQIFSTPYPEPSTNGALHYNRALLALSMVPVEEREILTKPIWEALGSASKSEIEERVDRLTHEGRHAIRAALQGTSCGNAEFGIDYSDYGHGAALPHTQPMTELGRLVTLAGIYAQIQDDWEGAAVFFFQGLRMGRHMTGQPTFAETVVGVQTLENNYFALAFWGAKCPDNQLVKQAFLRFEAASDTMVRPAFTLATEASIVKRQLERVRDAFPDGPWAEMLLESLGEFTIAKNKAALQEQAIKLCKERGVPAKVFEDKAEFDAYLNRLSNLRVSYFRSLAACMTLPQIRRARAANRLHDRAQAQLAKFSKVDLQSSQDIVSLFGIHSAERTMARVALAVSASRTSDGFPKNLADVAPRFSGQLPSSPYNGNRLEYQVLNDGKDFLVAIPAVTTDDTKLPRVEFSTVRAE